MPFTVGAIFMLPLVIFVLLLDKIPPPDAEDEAARMHRQPMPAQERKKLIAEFLPGLVTLIIIYMLVTILREVRDSFMADMWRDSGVQYNASTFTQTETIISLLILVMIASMIVLQHNYRAFLLTQVIMLLGFIISLTATIIYMQHHLSLYVWMVLVGLGLFMVYIPFNSILFDRFIATFRFSGNVGFLIYLADSFGYLGSVGVLLTKSVFRIQANWLQFYTYLVLIAGCIGIIGTIVSICYFTRKHQRRYYNISDHWSGAGKD
jgi:MFS family permease